MRKNKNNVYFLLLGVCLWGITACSTDRADAGASALKPGDAITVKSDTFGLASRMSACEPIYASPDSFLLGECETHFGAIKADVLTQFCCPSGFSYPHPENAEVDSVCLYLYYNSWYGDEFAPLGITAYEMDREILRYDDPYPSNDTITKYCSLEDSVRVIRQTRTFIPGAYEDSTYNSLTEGYTPYIRIRLEDDFARRFFTLKSFTTQDAFNQHFKGLYLSTDFGGATVLYVSNITMAVFYHFTYTRADGQDTTVNDIKPFYANSEVKQLNRFYYPDREAVLEYANRCEDSAFIIAPANIYTTLRIPMTNVYARMEEQLGDPTTYRTYINLANLKINVLYEPDVVSKRARDNWNTPSSYMLLIREEEMATFFAEHRLPDDTIAILGSLTSNTDSMEVTTYYYTYDLSSMLTTQLRATDPVDTLRLTLVPVTIYTTTDSNGSSTVSEVKQQLSISVTTIQSATNTTEPINLKMVYAAFAKTAR